MEITEGIMRILMAAPGPAPLALHSQDKEDDWSVTEDKEVKEVYHPLGLKTVNWGNVIVMPKFEASQSHHPDTPPPPSCTP